jgi:hypothetical protein
MVNDVTFSASDGLFDPPYLDICIAYQEESISQGRQSSSAVMQLDFRKGPDVSVRDVSIAMVL